MTLDDLLALLPDNTAGEISAADLRTIVTELYGRANSMGQAFSYQWTGAAQPAGGRVNMDLPWQMAATKLLISETTTDGEVLSFATLDNAVSSQVWLNTEGGATLHANVTGQSVDKGGYREVPISVQSVTPPGPVPNDKVSVAVIVVMS